jgi:hypothetical protein
LIESYRNLISVKEPSYLFLTSSTLKGKQRKEIFKLYILKNSISNLLVFDKKDKYINQEKKFNFLNSSAKILYQIEGTNELIKGKKFIRSEQIAQPLRSNLLTETMFSNI